MKFQKKGRIFGADTFNLPWFKKNAMVPTPYRLNDDTIRLYVTMCDAKNVGRLGYVDVLAENPSKILGVSKEPILDVGEAGTFDDNGVVTSSIYQENGKLYLYYSGYELCVKIPYRIFCGVAVSEDGGQTFKRMRKASLLLPIDTELYNRCQPYILKVKGGYRVFYLGDVGNMWRLAPDGHKVPMYTMKSLFAKDLLDWPLQEGVVTMPFIKENESGMTVPSIWEDSGMYKMIYSLRHVDIGYRIRYSESKDGIHFERKDDELQLIGQNLLWDSEMQCFARVYQDKNGLKLFYSGNHFGIGGVGWAELIP